MDRNGRDVRGDGGSVRVAAWWGNTLSLLYNNPRSIRCFVVFFYPVYQIPYVLVFQ